MWPPACRGLRKLRNSVYGKSNGALDTDDIEVGLIGEVSYWKKLWIYLAPTHQTDAAKKYIALVCGKSR